MSNEASKRDREAYHEKLYEADMKPINEESDRLEQEYYEKGLDYEDSDREQWEDHDRRYRENQKNRDDVNKKHGRYQEPDW